MVMPRQFSSMIFYYHLFIGEVRTIRNETTYPIHGKYPFNLNKRKRGCIRILIHPLFWLRYYQYFYEIFTTDFTMSALSLTLRSIAFWMSSKSKILVTTPFTLTFPVATASIAMG